MNLFLVVCADESVAAGYVADVSSGDLLGVSMGTTSDALNVGAFLLVRCTPTRANKLYSLFDGIQGMGLVEPAPTPGTMDSDALMFYALGKMDS